jgi:hypothetical protein
MRALVDGMRTTSTACYISLGARAVPVGETLAEDPWSETHLRIETSERWPSGSTVAGLEPISGLHFPDPWPRVIGRSPLGPPRDIGLVTSRVLARLCPS